MSFAWSQIALAALLASLLALLILLAVRIRWQNLTLPQIAGLTVCAGLGLTIWFLIFNTFSLGWLDFDFPIPLFPVSPEDLGCMLVTGLTTFIYWFAITSLLPQRKALAHKTGLDSRSTINNTVRLEWWLYLLPALASLIIDVYFI